MWKAIGLVGGLLVITSCGGVGGAPPDGSGKPRASALVELLGHEDAGVRAEAEASLARMGPEALEDLFAAMEAPDAETAGRARRLYRQAAASALELSLGEPSEIKGDNEIYLWCFLRNRSRLPLVVVNTKFYFQDRVLWSKAEEAGSALNWMRTVWRHGCSDVHPFEEKEFIVLPPGELGRIGWISIPWSLLAEGPNRLVGKYVFRRPERMDPRYFPTERIRRLYEAAVETDGILSTPFVIELGAGKALKE